jgi:hypothetical protein
MDTGAPSGTAIALPLGLGMLMPMPQLHISPRRCPERGAILGLRNMDDVCRPCSHHEVGPIVATTLMPSFDGARDELNGRYPLYLQLRPGAAVAEA